MLKLKKMIHLIVFSLTLLHLFGESGAVIVQPVSVVDGESVTLEIQRDGDIEWKFGPQNILIAEISSDPYKITLYEDALDGSFRGRLKLDQNGSLTISNIKTTDSGDYNVIDTSTETLLNTFKLTVQDVTDEIKSVSVMEGDSVILHTDVTEGQKYLLIQWMFGNSRIAEASKLTQTNSTYDGPDGRFRDRLYLDETGSLTITNIRITDSGLYQLTLIRSQTSYRSFNVTVYVAPQSTSSNFLSSPYALNNSTINQTEDDNSTDLHQSSSDHIHCCGFPEIVIRLVVSALVSVAAVAFLVYDIRSTRNELNRAEETRRHQQMHEAKSHQRYEPSRRMSSRYVY